MNSHIFEHTFGTGHCIQYQRLPSGTCYHADTPEPVVELLEQLRHSRRKIRLYYGDTQTPASRGLMNTMSSAGSAAQPARSKCRC